MKKREKSFLVLRFFGWPLCLFINLDKDYDEFRNALSSVFVATGVVFWWLIFDEPNFYRICIYLVVGLIVHFLERRMWKDSFLEKDLKRGEKYKKFIFVLKLLGWMIFMFINMDEDDGNSKSFFNSIFLAIGTAAILLTIVSFKSWWGLIPFLVYLSVGFIAHRYAKSEWGGSFLREKS